MPTRGSGHFGAALAGGVVWTISNSIFANNTSRDSWSPMTCTTTGSGSGDLQWPQNHVVGNQADSACVSGIRFADAQLSALQDNAVRR